MVDQGFTVHRPQVFEGHDRKTEAVLVHRKSLIATTQMAAQIVCKQDDMRMHDIRRMSVIGGQAELLQWGGLAFGGSQWPGLPYTR
jgi:hypothetical protein